MKLRYSVGNDIIFVDKPAGISTHAPEQGQLGLVELYEQQLGCKLYVAHRLDKTTTGALAFAKTQEKAQQLFTFFKEQRVRKKYLFVTDKKTKDENDSFSIDQAIEGQPALTHFQRIKRSPFFELWQAEPKTGRTHQIRIHAQQAGLSILGDTIYGGSDFPHLCLHAQELSLPDEASFTTPPPRFFERLGMLKDIEACRLFSGIDRRQRLFKFLDMPTESIRLSHYESKNCRLDLYGNVLWCYWYKDTEPTATDHERLQYVARQLGKKLCLRLMKNRGADPNANLLWTYDFEDTQWTASENLIRYQLKIDSGLSPGLFLDQRNNRQWVQENSKNKNILNLFSYTCGFSVHAAIGGARAVTSVDVSKKFLDWGKENFLLNHLKPENYEFVTQDGLLYLNGALKRNRQFDLIICDPPSFGRSKDRVFSFEKDWEELLDLCLKCLAPKGQILFSFNYEKWTVTEAEKRIKRLCHGQVKTQVPQLDFELPQQEPLLKSFLITT